MGTWPEGGVPKFGGGALSAGAVTLALAKAAKNAASERRPRCERTYAITIVLLLALACEGSRALLRPCSPLGPGPPAAVYENLCPSEDRVEHRFGQHARVGVLAARMVGSDKDDVVPVRGSLGDGFHAVRELRRSLEAIAGA